MHTVARISILLATVAQIHSLQLNIDDQNSIKTIASQIAKGLHSYYDPQSTAGQFVQPQPWFWWESGAGWTGLVNYQAYTNDTTYQNDILTSLAKNLGPNNNFVPPEQANWEASDDQAYWVYGALTAMEYSFPSLPCSSTPCPNSWDTIAKNAFNDFVNRWTADIGTCNGGMKWQYRNWVKGYDYKNAVTNGGFFQTAARLARFTGDSSYADWAIKVWDWSVSTGLVSGDFHVYDGTSDGNGANCATINKDEWSYNIGTYLHGAAHMYAYCQRPGVTTCSVDWEARVKGLLNTAKTTFFSPYPNATNVMFEQRCELTGSCSVDQTIFKASLVQWMGKAAVLVPSVANDVLQLLRATAIGVVSSCTDDNVCGMKWYLGQWDGQKSFGVQLSALEAVQSLMIPDAPKLAFASSQRRMGRIQDSA